MGLRDALLRIRANRTSEMIIKWLDVDVKSTLANVNFPVYLQLSRNISELLTANGGQETRERELFRRLSQATNVRTFWDVGANIGQYSWEFLSLPGTRRAVMFEPDPRNVATIRKTIKSAQLVNCIVQSVALSDTIGLVGFNIDPITGKQGSIIGDTNVGRLMGRSTEELKVSCSTIDYVAELQNIRPDIVKIDVEGAELKVLAGGTKTLSSYQPILFIEVKASNFDEASARLGSYGYELFDAATCAPAVATSFNILALNMTAHGAAFRIAASRP